MRFMSLFALALCLATGPVAARAPQTAETRVYTPGDGVLAPVLVKEVKPQYTADAMRARIQGVVTLECVVQPDGAIGEARVTKALNPALDQEAIKAVKQWRFKPGLKDGKPVPVRVNLEMTFTLRDPPAPGGATKPPLFPARPLTPGDAGATSQPEAPLVYKPGAGVSAPVVVKEVRPQYTPDAKDAKTQGTVLVECVVQADGTIGDVKVLKSLDAGLDQEAIKAVRQWRFEPGTKDGKPVPVMVTLEMTFTLR
jgi:periplasmic protein TonB